ncbi:AfsR/SARP family transcriptional regulator [Streptomyces sp. B6B3]|uniref:AfsR/SARP family transcriptional regulator n=1 Tax=Streptomyces sp. B6B3 TaxID=3153570 RepID=UPI00325F339E
MMRVISGRFDYGDFCALSRSGQGHLRVGQYVQAEHRLRAALALWRGPALTDVTEYLAETERPSIDEAYMETLECRISANLALGQHAQLTKELVGLVQAYPLRERLRAQLMMALYASDRQADAFAVFHEGRQRLAEELGVDPGAALQRTYQAILTGRMGDSASETSLAPMDSDTSDDLSHQYPTPFLVTTGDYTP